MTTLRTPTIPYTKEKLMSAEAKMRYLLLILMTLTMSFPTLANDNPDIIEVARFGRGIAHTLAWRPDGEVLAVGSSTGIWFFDEAFNELGRLAEDTPIDTLEWSPDGQHLITFDSSYQTDNCKIMIWNVSEDVQTASQDKVLNHCAESVDWSPDDKLIAFGVGDRYTETTNIKLISSDTYEVVREYENMGKYVAFSPSSQRIAINHQTNGLSLTILDLTTKTTLQEIYDLEVFGQVYWSFDGYFITTGCNLPNWEFYGTCNFNSKIGELIYSLDSIPRLFWNPSENSFISQVIDFYGGSSQINLHREFDDQIHIVQAFEYIKHIQWHPSGQYITVLNKHLGIDGFVTNIDIDIQNLSVTKTFPLFSSNIKDVLWNPKNHKLLSNSESAIYVWNWETNQASIRNPETRITQNIGTITQTDTETRWVSDNEFIAISLTTDYGINFAYDNRIHDSSSGEVVDTPLYYYSYFDYLTDEGGLPMTKWSNSLEQVAYTSFDNREEIIVADELFTESETTTFTLQADRVRQIEWSPDSSMIATGGIVGENDVNYYLIEIWDGQTGEQISTIQRGYLENYDKFYWSPDSSKILIVGERLMGGGATSRFLTLYDVGRDYNQWEVTQMTSWYEDVWEYPNQLDVTWSPNGRVVAISFDSEIRFYDVESKELITTIENDTISSLDWHENGRYLAGGASDGTIYVWDVSALLD